MASKKQRAFGAKKAKGAFKRAGVLRPAAPGDRKAQRKRLAKKAVRGTIRKTGRRQLKAGRGRDPK